MSLGQHFSKGRLLNGRFRIVKPLEEDGVMFTEDTWFFSAEDVGVAGSGETGPYAALGTGFGSGQDVKAHEYLVEVRGVNRKEGPADDGAALRSTLIALGHPGVNHHSYWGYVDGFAWVATQGIGESLSHLGRSNDRQWILQVGAALAAAHAVGVIWRGILSAHHIRRDANGRWSLRSSAMTTCMTAKSKAADLARIADLRAFATLAAEWAPGALTEPIQDLLAAANRTASLTVAEAAVWLEPCPIEPCGITLRQGELEADGSCKWLVGWASPGEGYGGLLRLPPTAASLPDRPLLDEELWRLGQDIPATGLAEAEVYPPARTAWRVVPYSMLGRTARLGFAITISRLPDVENLQCRREGSFALLTWDWQDHLLSVVVSWRTDDHPLSPDEAHWAKRLRRDEYDRMGCCRIPLPLEHPILYITVFGTRLVRGNSGPGLLYSPGLTPGSRTVFDNHRGLPSSAHWQNP